MHFKMIFIHLLGARCCSRLWDIVVNKTKLLVLMKLPFSGRDTWASLYVSAIHSGKIHVRDVLIMSGPYDMLIFGFIDHTKLVFYVVYYICMRAPLHLTNLWHFHMFKFCICNGWKIHHYKLNLHFMTTKEVGHLSCSTAQSVVGCCPVSSSACSRHQLNFFTCSFLNWNTCCFLTDLLEVSRDNNVCLLCAADNFIWSMLLFSLYTIICWAKAFNDDKCFHFFLWLYFWIVLYSDHEAIL